ncbi:hypothetical protein F4811DRAFT_503799, partial [Daldinia bambusicola]
MWMIIMHIAKSKKSSERMFAIFAKIFYGTTGTIFKLLLTPFFPLCSSAQHNPLTYRNPLTTAFISYKHSFRHPGVPVGIYLPIQVDDLFEASSLHLSISRSNWSYNYSYRLHNCLYNAVSRSKRIQGERRTRKKKKKTLYGFGEIRSSYVAI